VSAVANRPGKLEKKDCPKADFGNVTKEYKKIFHRIFSKCHSGEGVGTYRTVKTILSESFLQPARKGSLPQEHHQVYFSLVFLKS
jgi:hypothetical protein